MMTRMGMVSSSRFHPAFHEKTIHKKRFFELLYNFWRNPTADVNAAGCHHLQGKVPRFCSVEGHIPIQRLNAKITFPSETCACDYGSEIIQSHLFGESRIFRVSFDVAQKFIQKFLPVPGEHPLVTHPAKLGTKISQKFTFDFVAGCKICVAPFAGKWNMALPIPKQAGFAKSGADRNDRPISCCVRIAGLKRNEICRLKGRNAMSIGFEVIDKYYCWKFKFACE